jgi:hypothetical protein
MSVVRRKKENIDMLEHAMMGVRTSENHSQIVSFDESRAIVGSRSRVQVDVRDETQEEREVIVTIPKVGKRRTA